MTGSTTVLPAVPAALADRILAVGDAGLIDALTAQVGQQAAFPLLAEAYSIAADRLRNS